MSDIGSNEVWDYIVIGAGLTGLGMAALLSFEGSRVLVIENESIVGGRSRTTKKMDLFWTRNPFI